MFNFEWGNSSSVTKVLGRLLGKSEDYNIEKVKAKAVAEYYEPNKKYSFLTIKNCSHIAPVEIVLNQEHEFGSDFHMTTFSNKHPNEYEKVITLEPKETRKINLSLIENIGYRSKMGYPAPIELHFGSRANISSGKNESPFEDVQVLRFNVRAVNRNNEKVVSSRGGRLVISFDGGLTWEDEDGNSNVIRNPEFESGHQGALWTDEGTLLVNEHNYDEDTVDLLRSTDDGETWETVINNMNYDWRGGEGIQYDRDTGIIMYAENPQQPDDTDEIRIMKSTDDGQTFEPVLTKTGADIRHFHSIQIDPFTGNWLATTGDNDGEIEWWLSEDDGDTWNNLEVPSIQDFRTLGVIFTDKHYLWVSDNPLRKQGMNYIMKAPKDGINNIDNAEKIMNISAVGFMYKQINEKFLLGTKPSGSTPIANFASLFMSTNFGETWETVIDWPVDEGETAGFDRVCGPDREGYLYFNIGSGCDGMYNENNSTPFYRSLKVKLK